MAKKRPEADLKEEERHPQREEATVEVSRIFEMKS